MIGEELVRAAGVLHGTGSVARGEELVSAADATLTFLTERGLGQKDSALVAGAVLSVLAGSSGRAHSLIEFIELMAKGEA